MAAEAAYTGQSPGGEVSGPSRARSLDAELVAVTKVYEGGVRAVDGISLAVEHGEFFSLLGPSGCGKSTTLRLIAGLEHPTAGEIRIRGEAMGGRPPHRRPTNMVFQQLALFPHLDVAENVAFGLRLKRRPRAEIRRRVDEALEMVQLIGYHRRRMTQLSGGQQQRVAIARALVMEPAVLLLDEPLGALDLRLRLQMQEALKSIQRRSSTTFVYVTHDQGEALTMSDRIAIMNLGRVEQVGAPVELYERPRTRFAATFLGDTNLFEGRPAGSGRLDVGGLSLRVSGGDGFAISIRPERIRIGRPGAVQGANVLGGRLQEVVYLGSYTRYLVRLGDGRTVLAQRQNQPPFPDIGIGDEVQVGWDLDAGVVLKEPQEESEGRPQ